MVATGSSTVTRRNWNQEAHGSNKTGNADSIAYLSQKKKIEYKYFRGIFSNAPPGSLKSDGQPFKCTALQAHPVLPSRREGVSGFRLIRLHASHYYYRSQKVSRPVAPGCINRSKAMPAHMPQALPCQGNIFPQALGSHSLCQLPVRP